MPNIRAFLPHSSHTTHSVDRGLAAVTAAAGLALMLAACGNDSTTGSGSHSGHSGSSSTATAGSGTEQHSAADVTFAQSMIPHHQQAVEMARTGASKAASPAVKQLAAQIQAAQDPEITTMTGWLSAWGQPTSMSGMSGMAGHSMDSMPGMTSDSDMTELGTLSGSAFDREFLTMMTAHHTGAIEMARTELAQGQYGPAKDLATRIVADQTSEIAKMKTLLTQV